MVGRPAPFFASAFADLRWRSSPVPAAEKSFARVGIYIAVLADGVQAFCTIDQDRIWADYGPTALKERTAKADIKLPIRWNGTQHNRLTILSLS